jgi:hypothetical protein
LQEGRRAGLVPEHVRPATRRGEQPQPALLAKQPQPAPKARWPVRRSVVRVPVRCVVRASVSRRHKAAAQATSDCQWLAHLLAPHRQLGVQRAHAARAVEVLARHRQQSVAVGWWDMRSLHSSGQAALVSPGAARAAPWAARCQRRAQRRQRKRRRTAPRPWPATTRLRWRRPLPAPLPPPAAHRRDCRPVLLAPAAPDDTPPAPPDWPTRRAAGSRHGSRVELYSWVEFRTCARKLDSRRSHEAGSPSRIHCRSCSIVAACTRGTSNRMREPRHSDARPINRYGHATKSTGYQCYCAPTQAKYSAPGGSARGVY